MTDHDVVVMQQRALSGRTHATGPDRNGDHRGRPGRDRCASPSCQQFRTKDGEETTAPLGGVDSMMVSLTAKGLTTGEIEVHLAEC
jgi:hypothetical protein